MYSAIRHYWRGVYNDLTQHVRQCDACFEGEKLARPPGLDITSLPDQAAAAERQQRSAAAAAAASASGAVARIAAARSGAAAEQPPAVPPEAKTKVQVTADRATRVWKKVMEGLG